MTSPSSITFRTSAVEIIRFGCDIWRTACGKKSIRCEARSRINCRNSILIFIPQMRMIIDVERMNSAAAEGATEASPGTAC
jgi:hypothetical protein